MFRFKTNKYGAVKTMFNGVLYDSKLEAKFAGELEVLRKAGEIVSVEPHFSIPLVVAGKLICRHEVDFKVVWKNGVTSYEEVKGRQTNTYKIKLKLLKALYPEYIYRIHTKDKSDLNTPVGVFGGFNLYVTDTKKSNSKQNVPNSRAGIARAAGDSKQKPSR